MTGNSTVLGRSIAQVTVVLFAVFSSAGLAEGLSRPAVELLNPPVSAPIETAGTGLAPEASVKVMVDERGHIVSVEVPRIVPSTEHDELFIREIEETLGQWRYAPKLENGVAVPVELSWTLQFVPRSEAGRGVFGDLEREGALESRWARYLAMERSQREKVLEEISQQMIEQLVGRVTRHETPRFIVITDADQEAAEAIGNNLETLYNVLQDLLLGTISLQPEPLKIVTVAYQRQASYRSLVSIAEHFEWSAGYYHPSGAIAFHLEAQSQDLLLGLILHEATHAFFDRHVVAPGVTLPRWLAEGLAEYMGNSKIEKNRLVPGKTRRRKIELTLYGAGIRSTGAWMDATAVKRAVRGKRGISLYELFNAGPEIFYSDKRRLFYPTSWFLVHFLRHGAEEWESQQFPEFLTYVAEGFPAGVAFERAYGRSIPAMEDDFREYILKF